ncbi:putative membrane protein YdfK [bioreactor metagenome]|uniref:Putative membrane protein YdfK n=1 Tax=bioreactor metagenome TaxID=1076179 RepID=A0A645IIB9_9ZZZZ
MSIKTEQPLIVIASIAVGSVIGELLDLEGKLEKGCASLESRIGDNAKGFSAGFIAASLIYCTGSMAVLGSFEEGLGGYPSLLLAKGLIDGLTSIAIAASLGFGVIFASVPVFLYQGTLTLAAGWIQPFMSQPAIIEMSATGGLMLVGIGINLLGFMKIRVMNMLPGLVIAVVLVQLFI